MFVLVKISDVVQIDAKDFFPAKESGAAIEDNLNRKYANKVIQNIGLCISLWDLLKASEGLISQSSGTGTLFVNVEFRLIVFRPFKGEILQGVILETAPAGIRLSMDFFSDVWIPAANLHADSVYKEHQGEMLWIWDPSPEADGEANGMDGVDDERGEPFFYDLNEPVRFRVEAEVWNDHSPQKPPGEEDDEDEEIDQVVKSEGGGSYAVDSDGKRVKVKDVPYTIIGAMDAPGLGPILWWQEEQGDGGAEEPGE